MSLGTRRTDAGIALLRLGFGYLLDCEDGNEIEGGIRPLAYFDATQVMPPGRLDLDISPTADATGLGGIALHLHGELDRHLGSGTLATISPWLTDDLQAQLCQTGEQSWRLWRTDPGFLMT